MSVKDKIKAGPARLCDKDENLDSINPTHIVTKKEIVRSKPWLSIPKPTTIGWATNSSGNGFLFRFV